MQEPKANRMAWGIAAILAVVVLGGVGRLGVRLRPYWVAKYRGKGADLHGVFLILAPLRGADLEAANLQHADLAGADLTQARLDEANLRYANLADGKLA